jgi:hypothetical protein
MSASLWAAGIIAGYRLLSIAIGAVVVAMGYRLFRVGMFERAGELKAAWGDRNLTIRQAAPGTFFAIFGAVIVLISLWKGVSIEQTLPNTPNAVAQGETASDHGAQPDTSLKRQGPPNAPGTMVIGGLGGRMGNVPPLSMQLRGSLSEFGLCDAGALGETTRERCRDTLTRVLKVLPTRGELSLIDSLESVISRSPDTAAARLLDNLRRRFIK